MFNVWKVRMIPWLLCNWWWWLVPLAIAGGMAIVDDDDLGNLKWEVRRKLIGLACLMTVVLILIGILMGRR